MPAPESNGRSLAPRWARFVRDTYDVLLPVVVSTTGLVLTVGNAFVWKDPAIWPGAFGALAGGGLLTLAVSRLRGQESRSRSGDRSSRSSSSSEGGDDAPPR